MTWIRKYSIFITIFLAYLALAAFDQKWTKGRSPMATDTAAYYSYLPYAFIHKDFNFLTDSTFIEQHKAINKYEPESWFMLKSNTGKPIPKVTMGVAIMELPGFLVANIISKAFNNERTGYESIYKLMFILSNIVFSVLGLFFLHRVLLRDFSLTTSNLTILIIAFCTNFLFYSVWFTGMAHNYSFFLISLFLFYLPAHIQAKSSTTSIIWLIIGLLTLIRPTNIFFGLLFLFYKAPTKNEIIERISFLLRKPLLPILFFMIPITAQLIFWKANTGSWVVYSYEGEGFDFTNPQIINGWFSFRKGLFIYTPVLLLIVPAFFWIFKRKLVQYYFFPILFVLFSLIIFSWWSWYYGGSFGSRAMIDFYPLLSLPLAITIKLFWKKQSLKLLLLALLVSTSLLNLLQSYQYKKGIIHHSEMTREAYFYTFGKLHLSLEEREKLETLLIKD